MIFTRMVSITTTVVLLACLLAGAQPFPVHAETKVITADASYIMGDGETPDFAEARALQKAKQTALEEAGTYVQSYTKVQNLDLTAEEIQTIAGGVLQVEILEKTRTLISDGLRFYTKIKATVTTEKMEELARRIKGKNVAEEYQKLQTEFARLSRELEDWKQRAANASQGPERKLALDQIREGEKSFALVQQREADLFHRLVSGQQLVEQANRDKNILVEQASRHKDIIDKLLETILMSGYVVAVGDVQAVAIPWHPDQLVLKVPLTIQVSTTIQKAVSDAANVLGGSVQPGLARFNKKIRVGSENPDVAPVTQVHLSKNSELEDYFQREVQRIGLQLIFQDGTNYPYHCLLYVDRNPERRLDVEWRRIFGNSSETWLRSKSIRKFHPPSRDVSDDYLDEYVVIVGDGARVVAENILPTQSAGKLTGVSVRVILITNELYKSPRCAIVQ